jgi:uncharacterized membrane protein YqaE (UPF0057 family)
MKTINYLVALIAGMALLASCSVEKRVHRDGYHVEWHGKNRMEKNTNVDRNEMAQQTNEEKKEISNGATSNVSKVEKPLTSETIKISELTKAEVQTPAVEHKNKPKKREAIRAISQLKEAMDKSAATSVSRMDNTENGNEGHSSQADIIVCVIFAILIPPLGVYLFQEEITTDFWITLLLTLLFWLGALYALYVILAK